MLMLADAEVQFLITQEALLSQVQQYYQQQIF
jgi:hypothetical protein